MFFLPIFFALLGLATALPTTLNVAEAKRWFGVAGGNNLVNPWPVMASDEGTPRQWVRYCYKDSHSATTLTTYVDEAVKMWLPAIAVSSLNIQLDPGTGGDPSVYCDQLAAPIDALVISNEVPGSCATRTSVGYNYRDDAAGDATMRHSLRFCQYSDNPSDADKAMWIMVIAHELGTF